MKPITNASYQGVDQRSCPRTDVYARVPLNLPDGQPAMVTIVNISADGALIRHEQTITDNGIVHFSMPILGKVAGRCIWSLGGRSGIQFLQGMPLSDYAPLLRALGANV